MHFELLVEDRSGEKLLEIVVPKILGEGDTFKLHHYRGVGRLPNKNQNLSPPDRRILLERLPRLLQGYGDAFANSGYSAAVIVVCDLDDNCLKGFRAQLMTILANCKPAPLARFCIAIEEGEAWLLGDWPAIENAYPKAKRSVIGGYRNDSICGTWEKLADALYPGGARVLAGRGWQAVGEQKFKWAESIAPHMDVDANHSPSFAYFRETLRKLANSSPPSGKAGDS